MTPDINFGVDHLVAVNIAGQGGFATVYEADDTRFDRRVAVKVLAKSASEKDRERFNRECRIMGRLSQHPNVVTVYDNGYTPDGRPFIVMELIKGGSLADHLRRNGPLPWREAVNYVIPIAEALGDAHEAGVLHRDIKPENILLHNGVSRLSDFGIAQLSDSTSRNSTHITASWLHTAPETFNNNRDERSDLYSLGSTIYELISGHAPFWVEGEDSMNPLFMRLMSQPAPPLEAGGAPPALSAFVSRTLAKEPTDRPQTAAQFASELKAILDGTAGAGQAATGGATMVVPDRQAVHGHLPAPPSTGGAPVNSEQTVFVPPQVANSGPGPYGGPTPNSGQTSFAPPQPSNSGPGPYGGPTPNSGQTPYPPQMSNSGPGPYGGPTPNSGQTPFAPPQPSNSGPGPYGGPTPTSGQTPFNSVPQGFQANPQGYTSPYGTGGNPPPTYSQPQAFASPVPGGGSGGSGGRTMIIVALVVIMVVALVGGAIALSGGDDDEVATGTTATTPAGNAETTVSTAAPVTTATTAPPVQETTVTTAAAGTDEQVTINVFDLTVGHCFLDSNTDTVGEVITVPCSSTHFYEAFYQYNLADGAWPGVDTIRSDWENTCTGSAFTDYVGVEYLDSSLGVTAIYPSEETWADGDRIVVCSLFNYDETDRTATARGSNE